MRFIAVLLVSTLLIVSNRVQAGEDSFAWDNLAGWTEEIDAEELELRDELIPANLSFLSAFVKAALEAESLAPDDPRYALAWARVEYLTEASYRLLEDTGEYEAFLKATAPWIMKGATPSESADADDPGEGKVDDGGLVFETASGKRLLPTLINDRIELVDSESADIVPSQEVILAKARQKLPDNPAISVPLVKARITWLRIKALERLGRHEEISQESLLFGFVDEWFVIGPLEQDIEPLSGIGLTTAELEIMLHPRVEVSGKNSPVGWRSLSSLDPEGRVFVEALYGTGDPAKAYCAAIVHSEENQAAVIHFGSSGPATVRLNNSPLHASPSMGAAIPGQDVFNVWLRRGWNLILVKTFSGGERWRFTLRVTKPDGTPVYCPALPATDENMQAAFGDALAVIRKSILDQYYVPGREAERGGLSALSRYLSIDANDSRANFYLGTLLAARRLMEGPERYDRELIFRRAIESSGFNPYFLLMAARLAEAGVEGPDREENLRLLLLKMAVDKGSSAAIVDIGRLYLDVISQPRRAGEYSKRALEANPMSLRAGVLAYDVAAARHWQPLASSLLDRLRQRHPAAAAVRLRTGRTALTEGKYRTALSEFHALLGIDAANDEALQGAVKAFRMLGQNSAAVELLTWRLARFPYDSMARLRLAELYRDIGNSDDALHTAKVELENNPASRAALDMLADLTSDQPDFTPQGLPQYSRHSPYAEKSWDIPAVQPPEGWEYLYFQVEDRMNAGGAINRHVSFAIRMYTEQAAEALRDLDFNLESELERGFVEQLSLLHPDGTKEDLTPSNASNVKTGLHFRLPPLSAGMTILADVEIQRDRIAFLGDYFGQVVPLGQPASIRLARYMFSSPKDRRLFFLPVNGAPNALMVEDESSVTRIWEMNDLPAYVEEPYGPGRSSQMPSIQISSFKEWDEFARWYWRLIGAQYHSPPELRLLAERLAGNRDESALALLDNASAWVAENLGNREWEFGPYAFRPISVRAILSRRTADGKDRTLLLCLLAKEYGLNAWPTLARSWDAWRSLPHLTETSLPLLDHFNYSLASVDSGPGGYVYYEADNRQRPPGIMSPSLYGAHAMLLRPDGAEHLIIPDEGLAGCEWRETADVIVDPDGSLIWEEKITASGTAAEALRARFAKAETADAAWENFLSSIGGDPSTSSVEFANSETKPAEADFFGKARLRQWAKMDPKRVVLRLPPLPGRLNRSIGDYEYPLSLAYLVKRGEREQDLILPSAFRIVRRINISYPPEWKLENLPEQYTHSFAFGSILVRASHSSGNIALEHIFEITERRIDPDEYASFRKAAAYAERWLQPLFVWEKP